MRKDFNPVQSLSDSEFVEKYRITKEAFLFICEELRLHSKLKPSVRSSLELKVLTSLFFYATGSSQRPVGSAKYISQKCCSRFLEEVTDALTHPYMLSKYIVFPQSKMERKAISQKFNSEYGFPGVIGSIDCSHIKIFRPPVAEEHLYVCRNYHSINVQMICDSDYRIINVNPKYGGASHDSYIWENSLINNYIQNVQQRNEMVWLLGDSEYYQRPWLMTPYLNVAADSPEGAYNKRHMAAWVTIESTFGRLKSRWRCLCKDKALHYKPTKCAKIIQACCVLYNIALDFGCPEPEDYLEHHTDSETVTEQEEEMQLEAEETSTDLIRGRALREQLVEIMTIN